jgi:hypothetical protein
MPMSAARAPTQVVRGLRTDTNLGGRGWTHRFRAVAFAALLVASCRSGQGSDGGVTGGASGASQGGATSSATGGVAGTGGASSSTTARSSGGVSGSLGGVGGGTGGRSAGGGGGVGGASGIGGSASGAGGAAAGGATETGVGGTQSQAGGAVGKGGGDMGGATGTGGMTGGRGGAGGNDGGGPDALDALGDSAVDAPAADAQSFPGTNNPVLPGLFADPNIVTFDGTFYLYPTTDGFASWGATSFSVFSSTNLVQWNNRGVVLDVPTALTWATGHAWAPSITRVGSTYYFYFSADSQLGVATGSSPTGPFKDALGKPLATTREYGPQSIDPYAFIDDDGTPYLYFGSASGGLRVVKLSSNMISFSGTPTNISPSGASGTLEGSAVFKRKGSYYLVWSEGDTRTATYQMAYARASSPTGPFTRLATILQQDTGLGILGPGGGTVLAIPNRDEYYLVYHRFQIPGGDGTHRETCIDRMSFGSDGSIVPVKPSLTGLQAAVAP